MEGVAAAARGRGRREGSRSGGRAWGTTPSSLMGVGGVAAAVGRRFEHAHLRPEGLRVGEEFELGEALQAGLELG